MDQYERSNSDYMTTKTLCLIMKTERNLSSMVNILSLSLMNRKIQGWNKIKQSSFLDEEKTGMGIENMKGKRSGKINMVEEWK